MPLPHIALAVLVTALWGINFVVIKIGLHDFPPLMLCALRFLFAALPAVFFLRRPDVPWKWIVALGATLGVVKFGLLFVSMKVGVSAGLASLVLQSQSFFTLLLAVLLLGERLTLMRVLAAAIAFSGIGVLVSGADTAELPLTGLALAICAAVAWGFANLIQKRCAGSKPLNLMVWASLIPPVPLMLLSFGLEAGPAQAWQTVQAASLAGWGAVVFLAAIATLLGFAIWGWLMGHHPAAQVAPFTLMVPVWGMGSAALLLGESLTPAKLLAAALILSGLILNTFGDRLLQRLRPQTP